MKYCKSCKALCFGDELPFDGCKHKLSELSDVNEPVRLCVVGGTERAMITGLLSSVDIPYMEQNVQPMGLANDIVTGYDVKLSNISLLVPFSALPKASELLSSIETVENKIEPHMDEIEAEIARLRELGDEETGRKLSPAVRTTIKVVTAILFLIIIGVAVIGTDKLTEWIKSLF